MQYALIGGELVTATREERRGICPCCGSETIAKCGSVIPWHWAHKNSKDCDSWAENEGFWHRSWKDNLPDFKREVVIRNGNVFHRADLALQLESLMYIVELQHSYISAEDIQKREAFYGHMLWVVDCTNNSFKLISLKMYSQYPLKSPYYTSKDTHIPITTKLKNVVLVSGRVKGLKIPLLSTSSKPIFLDCGEYIVEVIGRENSHIQGYRWGREDGIERIKELVSDSYLDSLETQLKFEIQELKRREEFNRRELERLEELKRREDLKRREVERLEELKRREDLKRREIEHLEYLKRKKEIDRVRLTTVSGQKLTEDQARIKEQIEAQNPGWLVYKMSGNNASLKRVSVVGQNSN